MSKSTINNWGFYFDIENQQILNEDNIVFLNCFQQCPIITCNMENQLYDKNTTSTQTVKNASSNNREPPKINKPIDETSYVINYDPKHIFFRSHSLRRQVALGEITDETFFSIASEKPVSLPL